jgi:hypothetical protein
MLIPGTNGGKMSKSANNIINISWWQGLQSKSWALKPTVPLEEPKTRYL